MKNKKKMYLLILSFIFFASFLNLSVFADEKKEDVKSIEVKVTEDSEGRLKFSKSPTEDINVTNNTNKIFKKGKVALAFLFGIGIFYSVIVATLLFIKLQINVSNPQEKGNLKRSISYYLIATALLGSVVGVTALFWGYF